MMISTVMCGIHWKESEPVSSLAMTTASVVWASLKMAWLSRQEVGTASWRSGTKLLSTFISSLFTSKSKVLVFIFYILRYKLWFSLDGASCEVWTLVGVAFALHQQITVFQISPLKQKYLMRCLYFNEKLLGHLVSQQQLHLDLCQHKLRIVMKSSM